MRSKIWSILLAGVCLLALLACEIPAITIQVGGPAATATPVPPTVVAMPPLPTNTPVPPPPTSTNTPVLPTSTATPIPPTPTSLPTLTPTLPPTLTPTRTLTPSPAAPPRRLDTGAIIKQSPSWSAGGESYLAITNTVTIDAVAVLTQKGDKAPLKAVYIRAGETHNIENIWAGEYDFYYVLGEDWDSANARFTRRTEYHRFGCAEV